MNHHLLPCPFCGSSDIDPKAWTGNKDKTGPGCDGCGALTETVEDWNRRAPAPTSEPGARDAELTPEKVMTFYDQAITQGGSADNIILNTAWKIRDFLATPASPAVPAKPFAGPGGWFSVDVLGNPMREYATGKWENAVWPSTSAAPAVSVKAPPDLLQQFLDAAADAGITAMPKLSAPAVPSPAPVAPWISVKDRLPPVDQLVMVYSPPTTMSHPNDVDISFDCIDPNDDDAASWLGHNEHYEHWCCVAKPEGSTGPREKAPYTHWMPIPPAPAASPLVEDAQTNCSNSLSSSKNSSNCLFPPDSGELEPSGNSGELIEDAQLIVVGKVEASDTERLDYLDDWIVENERKGWPEFHFIFTTDKTARQQIDAELGFRAQGAAE